LLIVHPSRLTDITAVAKARTECPFLGEAVIPKKHGFGRPRDYFITNGDKRYPSNPEHPKFFLLDIGSMQYYEAQPAVDRIKGAGYLKQRGLGWEIQQLERPHCVLLSGTLEVNGPVKTEGSSSPCRR
jgi:hypothetical protein